jgi:EmrB/QacA subfamily drug resistance transporter
VARAKSTEPLDRRLVAVALVVALGAVTPIVDMTIVAVALKTLSSTYDAPLSTVQWVITGYILTTAMVVPLTGWATDAFGGRRLWLVALGIFTVGSVLCAMAWSIESLIAFRLLQGVGAGLLGPVGTAIVARTAGRERMGRAMSVVGVPLVLGPVFSPLIGGALLDLMSWRWIFLINLPIGVIAIALSWMLFAKDEETVRRGIDVRGFLLLCPGVTLLVYGLVQVGSLAALSSAAFLVPSLAGVVLLAGFVRHALRTEHPLLDLRVLSNATVSSAGAIQFLMNATLSGSMMIFPLYYQIARGESALVAGLLLVPQGLGVAMTMPIAGRIVDRGKPSLLVLCGIPLLALGFLSFTQAGADGDYLRLGLSLWIIGVGAGCTIMPALTTAYRALEPQRIPHITATFSILQELGASSAVAVFIVVLESRLAVAGDAEHTAFGTVFWLPLTLVLLCLIPALVAWRSSRTPTTPDPEPVEASA